MKLPKIVHFNTEAGDVWLQRYSIYEEVVDWKPNHTRLLWYSTTTTTTARVVPVTT